MKKTIQVTLIDDQLQNCLVVQDILEEYKKIQLMGFYTDVKSFQSSLAISTPDIAIIDIDIHKQEEGLGLLTWIQKKHPKIAPIMLTAHSKHIKTCYQMGAKGYILKGEWTEVGPTILKVWQGNLVIPPSTAPVLIEQLDKMEQYYNQKVEQSTFSKKESEILQGLLKGDSKETICERMGISQYTLRRHIQNLRSKAQVKNTRELLKKYKNHA